MKKYLRLFVLTGGVAGIVFLGGMWHQFRNPASASVLTKIVVPATVKPPTDSLPPTQEFLDDIDHARWLEADVTKRKAAQSKTKESLEIQRENDEITGIYTRLQGGINAVSRDKGRQYQWDAASRSIIPTPMPPMPAPPVKK